MNQLFNYKTFSIFVIIVSFGVETRFISNDKSQQLNQGESKKYVIIDTDAGVDDGLGLMLAFDYHKRGLINILAVTCTYGNAYVDQVVNNVFLTRRVIGAEDIKVYRGAENPFLRKEGYEDGFFGDDGFGNASHSLPKVNNKIEKEHAVLAINRLAKQYPKQITLITLGPMTNLAMAIQLDPNVTDHLAQIVSMGGLIDLLGNVGPPTEFNFYNDPESVDLVLRKSSCPLTIVTWDVAMNHVIPSKMFTEITHSGTKRADFLGKIYQLNIKRDPDSGIVLCDILAVIAGVAPELVTLEQSFPVAMELNGNYTRGMLIINRSKVLITPFQAPRNATFVEKFDLQKSIEIISQMTQK